MKNFKFTIDGRSFLMGLFACLFFVFFSGFKPVPAEQLGRYHVELGESNAVILDTATGEFIIGFHNEWAFQKFGDEAVYRKYNAYRKYRKDNALK